MYTKPSIHKFGTFRELTQAGCSGMTDGETFKGSGPSTGDTPRVTNGTIDYCFTSAGSR
ncbi:MAG: hypothetical protein AVDCRST_MAG40-2710 [uncultured Gemmatimonadaceae bacterium]|uniref:Uncharacterized protein n=1 Tax=uncultured Gemmatimonadaceae bacterium TaxID=246130 RepID=A0A6J4M1P6_9BACT|nr:MAG: hypothetical protein AVDCRST_MAG40-2710 [uncultured Gemmatimonadaceae bacterium]